MKNHSKGFSPEERSAGLPEQKIDAQDEATLRSEFEIMQRLDFVFIKELGASTAEEYILKITELTFSPHRHHGCKKVR